MDDEAVLDEGTDADASRLKFAMGDLIADAVMLDGQCIRTAASGLSIENKACSVLKCQTGEAWIVRIVQVPSPSHVPGRIAATAPDGITTTEVDLGFQLSPAKEETSWIIEDLTRDGVWRSGCKRLVELLVAIGVDRENAPDVFHERVSTKLACVRGCWASWSRNGAIVHCGAS